MDEKEVETGWDWLLMAVGISKTHSYLVANFSTLQYLEVLFCLVATLLACELAMSSTEYTYKYYNYAQE